VAAKKAKQPRTCALCGVVGPVTREHVPPRALFLEPRPENTITVEVCAACNHGFHLDDEYFRVYVAAGAQAGTKLMDLWTTKVVGSSFARSGGLKGRLSDDRDELQEHAKTSPLQLFGGGELPAELVDMVQSFDAKRINAVVEKVVRCLYKVHTGMVLSGNLAVAVAPLDPGDWDATLNQRSGEVGHANEFVYRYEHLGSPDETWWLIFYEYHSFTVRRR
jgi:hypothetical protein